MSDRPLEEVISEGAFAGVLGTQGGRFNALAHALLARKDAWGRPQFFELGSEADALEAMLDDHGARHNRDFHYLRELVASLRGFALAGFSVAHLERRLDSYGPVLPPSEAEQAAASIRHARTFLEQTIGRILHATLDEEAARGIRIACEPHPGPIAREAEPRQKLPRNVGQEDVEDDEQKIAELASRFLQAAALFDELSARRIADPDERELWMQRFCSEERARVLEATVHNLQSAYDTWVKNTRLEADDPRLPKLRGHASAALHLLEAVTHLAHFVERHESGMRHEESERRLEALVRRSEVRDVTLNHLLYWASAFMRRGKSVAEDLLPAYTDVQELEVVLPDHLHLHARPCALLVGIVNRYATPVVMEIAGQRCNAGSILELMVAVGSHAEARRYTFRGDVNPLRDIKLLFDNELGENGIESLPEGLAYLRAAS